MSALHRLIVRAPIAPRVDLAGRTALVTGAAPGSLGFETARIMREWGASVVTTTRATLELTSTESVRSFVSWYEASVGVLDVLVNNAGVHLDLMSSWKEPQLVDGHEVHWRTNYLGTMQLTDLLLPLLLKGSAPRIVNVVSQLHARGQSADLLETPSSYSSWDAYGRSKLALVHATWSLSQRFPVEAVSLHPGSVLTDIATKGLAGHRTIGGLRNALRPVEALVLLTPTEGAQTSVFCASSPVVNAGYYEKCSLSSASPEAMDREVSALLWDRTQQWVAEANRRR